MSGIDREQLSEWLSAYIDGELNAEQTELIERLLREDEATRRLLDELRRTVNLISSLPRHPAPSSIAEDVQFRVERSDLLGGVEEAGAAAGSQRSPILTLISMAAALGFVVGGLWFMTGREADQAGPVTETVALAPKGEAESAPRGPAESAAVIDGKLLATADFRQKLLAGMGAGAVRSHGFDNETVRLQVEVQNEVDREAMAARLLGYLGEQRLADLADVASGESAGAAPEGSFYYRGSPEVNFPEAKQRQILVRASRREFDGLMDELARGETVTKSVALVAGPLSIRGFGRIRTALSGLGEPTPRFRTRGRGGAPKNGHFESDSSSRAGSAPQQWNASGEARPTGGELFGDLVKALGLDPQILADLAEPASDEGSEMPAVPASVVADAADTAELGKGPVLEEPSSLVERRTEVLDEALRRNAETTEAYVTLVVQLVIAEPEPSRPPTRARPPDESRSEQRDDSSPAE